MYGYLKTHSGRRDALAGILFLLPWLAGTIFFFLRQMVMVGIYAFSEADGVKDGVYKLTGWSNFSDIFTSDTTFFRSFFESVGGILATSVFILFFSLFVALILNSKFRGRALVRAIFFLPVIIATGPVLDIISGDDIAKLLMSGQQATTMYGSATMQDLLLDMGLPQMLADAFGTAISGIFNLSWKSGIQILLFLAGLQNVPVHLYEAAKVEGASSWESFWRVTFPIITPVLLLNCVYTVIDGFTDYSNLVVRQIVQYTQNLYLSYAAALGIIYFLVVFLLVMIIYGLINRKTFYM